ncbi:hypothetical protein LINPERHAP2_LOCUS38780 [Linum perenne]
MATNNKLVGGLPWQFGLLSKLQIFEVRQNYLTSTIPSTEETFKEGLDLHSMVRRALSNQQTMEVVDPILLNELLHHRPRTYRNHNNNNTKETRKHPEELLSSIMEIGVVCSSNIPDDRIDMSEVVSRLTVAMWTPKFNEEEPIRTILTWVRLPKLPIHFFNRTAVNRIGNHIGKTVRMDLATSEGARARYARVCVEIDISKPLLGKYMIGGRVLYVEYESLENIYFNCGMYGHKEDGCPLLIPAEATATPPPSSIPEMAIPDPDKEAGSWMMVSRRQKKKVIKAVEPAKSPSNGSRFTVLGNSNDQSLGEGSKANSSKADTQVSKPPSLVKGRTPLADKTNFERNPFTEILQSLNIPVNGSKDASAKDKSETLISVPVSYSKAAFVSPPDSQTKSQG